MCKEDLSPSRASPQNLPISPSDCPSRKSVTICTPIAKIRSNWAPYNTHQSPIEAPKTASFFILNRKPIRAWKPPSKRFYEVFLFRPIGKIRLIWAFFNSEPDSGSDGYPEKDNPGSNWARMGWGHVGGRGGPANDVFLWSLGLRPFCILLPGSEHNSFAIPMTAQWLLKKPCTFFPVARDFDKQSLGIDCRTIFQGTTYLWWHKEGSVLM